MTKEKDVKKIVEEIKEEQKKANTVSNARWMVVGLMIMALAFVLWRCAAAIGS